MLPVVSQTLVNFGNALLDREPWARQRLQGHAGKVIALRLDAREQLLGIDRRGHLFPAVAGAQANVQVGLSARQLPALLGADRDARLQAVHIQGEAALAHTLAELARQLRWDLEDDLARWLGDIPARRLVAMGRQGLGLVQQAISNFGQNFAEYAVHEADQLPRRADYQR
ncbi:MAG: SCP2 domain-containing protein [Pigmentiphaga sp.]